MAPAGDSYTPSIGHLELSPQQLTALVESPFHEDLAGEDAVALALVHGPDQPLPSPGALPLVVCWLGSGFGVDGPEGADLVIGEDDVDELVHTVSEHPLASATLAVLLRSITTDDVEAGLAQESAAYSVLQAGPEFARWRSTAGPGEPATDRSVVAVDRRDGELVITLDRPHRHNAITSHLRDELVDALALGASDPTIESVLLRGRGPSFCSGGDLAEFGSRPDPATAHLTRLAQSPARLLDRLRHRTTALVHGATLGGGIEMAAFVDRVVADVEARFALPEIGLGLIPGAGGTVSLTRRIGRQRTAALALTGRTLDARTALEWGLVDAVVESHDRDP